MDDLITCAVDGCGHKFSTQQDWEDHNQIRHNVKPAGTFYMQIELALRDLFEIDDWDNLAVFETVKRAIGLPHEPKLIPMREEHRMG